MTWKIAKDAGGFDDNRDASKDIRMGIEETPVVALATTAKAAQVARMAMKLLPQLRPLDMALVGR